MCKNLKLRICIAINILTYYNNYSYQGFGNFFPSMCTYKNKTVFVELGIFAIMSMKPIVQ